MQAFQCQALIVFVRVCVISALVFGCTSKIREGTAEYGLQSCFALKPGETVIPANKDVEQFYLTHCEIKGVSLAINRVLRASSGDQYSLICMVTDRTLAEIPSLLSTDTTMTQIQQSQGSIEIAKKKTEYRSALGFRNGYWLYYFMFNNEQIGRPFVIIIPSKDKAAAEAYFSSVTPIQERMNCELH